MNNYSKIGVVLLLMLTFISSYGQRPGREKIKTLKVAFITERLDLSSREAQVFWPIYNEHEENIEEMKRRERVEIRAQLMDFERLSEKEVADLLKQMIAIEKKKQQLHIAFIERMSEVISPKKTFLLIKAEEDFNKRLLRQIQQRNKGGGL